MDGDKYRQFMSLVDGVIRRVGANQVIDVSFCTATGGTLHLKPSAFERIAGQREISQTMGNGYIHRSFVISGHSIKALYEFKQPKTSTMPGEYIDLCCEILDEEIATILSEQTVIAAAEAVTDAT
jgi:hypothetical protein